MFIYQMGVVNTFLNGTLQEDIYMAQQESYVVPGKENIVCHLKKSLYGLKQSPRCWNKSSKEFIICQGFTKNVADPWVFIRKFKDQLTIVAVHVDDRSHTLLIKRNREKNDRLEGQSRSSFHDERCILLSSSKHQNDGRCFINVRRAVYPQNIAQVRVTRW